MVSETANGSDSGTWQRFPVRRIEDLRNAVLGAELETMQLSGPPLRGSLAFSASRGIGISTGVIGGMVGLRGVMARDAVTLLLCLTPGHGSRLWLDNIRQCDTAVVLPDCEIDAIFSPHTAYVAVTIAKDRLRNEVTRSGQRIDPTAFEGARCRGARIRPPKLEDVTRQVALIHRAAFHEVQPGFGRAVLGLFLGQLASAETAAEVSGPGRRAERSSARHGITFTATSQRRSACPISCGRRELRHGPSTGHSRRSSMTARRAMFDARGCMPSGAICCPGGKRPAGSATRPRDGAAPAIPAVLPPGTGPCSARSLARPSLRPASKHAGGNGCRCILARFT